MNRKNKRLMSNYKAKVMQLAGVISRYLHVPVGVAVFLAVIVVPKVLAVMMIVWYAVVLISARRLSQTRPDENGE